MCCSHSTGPSTIRRKYCFSGTSKYWKQCHSHRKVTDTSLSKADVHQRPRLIGLLQNHHLVCCMLPRYSLVHNGSVIYRWFCIALLFIVAISLADFCWENCTANCSCYCCRGRGRGSSMMCRWCNSSTEQRYDAACSTTPVPAKSKQKPPKK